MKHVPSIILAGAIGAILIFSAQLGFQANVASAETETLLPSLNPIRFAVAASSTGPLARNVKFIKEIYNKEQIPHWWHSQVTPFWNALYLSDGYFAVAGTCSPPVRAPEGVSGKGAGNNIGIQGGQYVFKEDGTLVERRNACYDGGLPNKRIRASQLYCNEGAACETSMVMVPTGGSTFVREMYAPHNVYGRNRPPLQYRVTSGKVSLVSKAYNIENLDLGENDQVIGNLVKVGDRILGIKQKFEDEDGSSWSFSNVLMTPSFGIIREWSVPTSRPPIGTPGVSGRFPDTMNEVLPYAGIGDYVIGLDQSVWADNKMSVFKVDDEGELTKVGTLPYATPNYLSPVYDAANPNRVAFLVNPSGGVAYVDVYEPDTNGIKKVRTYSLPGVNGVLGAYGIPFMAIAGEYTAYRNCGNAAIGATPVVGTTASPYEGCKVSVLKGDTLFAEFALPSVKGGPLLGHLVGNTGASDPLDPLADMPTAIALSPKGDLVVGSMWGALYLYKVGEGINPATGGPFGPGGPEVVFATSTPFGTKEALDLSKGYLLLLQALFGGKSGAEKSLNQAPLTQYESIFQEAIRLINSN